MRAIAVLILLALWCAPADAAVTVTVSSPTANSVHKDPLYVRAVTSSPYETAVTASVGTVTVTLTKISFSEFEGTVPLAGLTEGNQTLTVTATEQGGGTGTATVQRVFRYHVPPTLTITSPRAYDVLPETGMLRVTVSCTDGGAACLGIEGWFTTSNGTTGRLFSTADTTFDADVPLAYGGELQLVFKGLDALGSADVPRTIYLQGASPLLHRMIAAHGRILDADAQRVLWVDEVGDVWILYRDHCDNTKIAEGRFPESGALMPRGAAFWGGGMTELRDGVLIVHDGGQVIPSSVRSAGPFLAWSTFDKVMRVDTVTGVKDDISPPSGIDLAANGDVVYSISGEVHRWRDGVDTILGPGIDPSTDGRFVVAGRRTGGTPYELSLWDENGNRETLDPSGDWSQDRTFTVGHGRTAYMRGTYGNGGLWVREADGVRTQLTSFYSWVQLVGANGDIFFGQHGTVYRHSTDGVKHVTSVGRVVDRGHNFVLIGRVAFGVGSVPPCSTVDCAVSCDGGGIRPPGTASDAGVPDGVPDASGTGETDGGPGGGSGTGGGGGCCSGQGLGATWGSVGLGVLALALVRRRRRRR